MNSKNIRTFRRQLDTLADRLRGEVMALRDEAFVPPAERAEIAGHEAEEGRVRTVLTQEESILDEVEAALQRIEDGTFGQCASCSQTISHQRLEAVPYSRFCVGCAERHESGVT